MIFQGNREGRLNTITNNELISLVAGEVRVMRKAKVGGRVDEYVWKKRKENAAVTGGMRGKKCEPT